MARVRCQCGKLATTEGPCKTCNSDHPMRHWHPESVEEDFDPESTPVHAHPHDGKGHSHPVEEDGSVVS